MLKGENIIYVSNDYSPDVKTSSHQVVAILSQYNRILYVESGGMRRPQGTTRDFKRIVNKLSKWLEGVKRINDHVFVYTLFLLPFHKYALARKFNEWFVAFSVRRRVRQLGFENAILWFFIPHVGHLAGKLGEKAKVYYCTDEHTEMPGVDKEALRNLETGLLKKADVVFVTSRNMQKKKGEINSNVHYSPHAVRFDHFAKTQSGETVVAAGLTALQGTVVGYIGMVDIWFDQELLGQVAERLPHSHFVIVGRVGTDISILQRFPNIHFLGPKKFEELPSYLKRFDVCMIPFQVNELTRNLNPIKLKEYLAAGKPVVTTPLPDMEEYMEVIEMASESQAFAEKIEKLVREDSPDRIRQRMDRMREDSWESRVEKISQVVTKTLNTKAQKGASAERSST